jgi:hypothetical protein
MQNEVHDAPERTVVARDREEDKMDMAYNGMPAGELHGATWQKSHFSSPDGNCVELAKLEDGGIAVRNSRHPEGPALIYTLAEISAFIRGATEGHFDNLIR